MMNEDIEIEVAWEVRGVSYVPVTEENLDLAQTEGVDITDPDELLKWLWRNDQQGRELHGLVDDYDMRDTPVVVSTSMWV